MKSTCASRADTDGPAEPAVDAQQALYLTDASSEYCLGGLFQGLPGFLAMTPRLVSAFKSGEGGPLSDFGAELPASLEAMNRSVDENRLVRSWLPACRTWWRACKRGDAPSTWAAEPA